MEEAKEVRIICVSRGSELPTRIEALLRTARSQVYFEPNMDRVLERFEDTAFDVLVISSAAFNARRIDGGDLIEVITAKSPQTAERLFHIYPDRCG